VIHWLGLPVGDATRSSPTCGSAGPPGTARLASNVAWPSRRDASATANSAPSEGGLGASESCLSDRHEALSGSESIRGGVVCTSGMGVGRVKCGGELGGVGER